MTAIIREEPEPLPASTPAALRWIVERCLAKDPAERYDSTRDLYRELRQSRERLAEAVDPHAGADGQTRTGSPRGMGRAKPCRGIPSGWALAIAVFAAGAGHTARDRSPRGDVACVVSEGKPHRIFQIFTISGIQ
jgi:hypothetical protein